MFIVQGSAHMGPALTPAEVLVAIHDINPEKDGVPLKKVCLLLVSLVMSLTSHLYSLTLCILAGNGCLFSLF